ncbi:probable glutamate receptor [Penaeus monodon]|uniref:probable glutamate receptor n=1 Tax=Penaeus monodon TaxID=6687 RepID=UPI0018A746B3|nr:probable glutamate receptor [Penaeus monodon]
MALSGRHLRVGADIWVPWVDLRRQKDGSLGASGVAAAFFDIIAAKLNFSYTLVMPEDREWGRGLPNGSFTGMIGMCQREEVDMALGPFGVTWERAQVVDFSSTLYVDGFGIFLPRPRQERDLAGFTNPLAWQLYAIIWQKEPEDCLHGIESSHFIYPLRYGHLLGPSFLFTLALGIVMNWLARRCFRATDDAAVDDQGDVVLRPLWVVQALLIESIEKLPSRSSSRALLAAWLLAGLILSSAYRGVLTSLLAVPRVTVPVDSLEDLVSYGKIPWANEKGTSLHQLFGAKKYMDATSGLYKTIHDKGTLVVNAYEARERIKRERMAVLCDFFTMRKIMSDDFTQTGACNYYIAADPIKMAALVESGMVSRSVLALTSNATACLVAPGKEEGAKGSLVFTLIDLAGAFLLLAGGEFKDWVRGLLLAAAVLLAEKLKGSACKM